MDRKNIDSQTTGFGTSGESLKASKHLARRLREQIIDLAREAGPRGITINEAERQIDDHKGHSVSPRFAELKKRGALVRVLVGYGRPIKRLPKVIPRYITRYDEETKRNVKIHWLPEFAPAAAQEAIAPKRRSVEKQKPEAVSVETRMPEGVAV